MVLPNLKSETYSDGKRYYTSPSGKRLPSVTTVVGAMKKQAIMEWRNRVGEVEANRISKLATGRGNRVHDLAEQYLKNEKIEWVREMPDSVEMFRTLIPHLHRINNIHYIEQALWSERIGLAGRVDLIAEWDGVLSIIDYKTSKRPKKREYVESYFIQEAAYAAMFLERTGVPIKQIVTVIAVDDNEPQVYIEKAIDHLHKFVELRKKFKEQRGI